MDNIELVKLGQWHCDLTTGELSNGQTQNTLEPKTIELLSYFLNNHSKVLPKEQIVNSLWEDTIVSDEVLAKTISKLRKALNDNPKTPEFIETLPKRGYRFKVAPQPIISNNTLKQDTTKVGHTKLVLLLATVAIAIGTVFFIYRDYNSSNNQKQPSSTILNPELSNLQKQADDYYFQYTRADNENAIRLYERIIAAEPNFGPAQSGLATALVQKVLRWPNELGTPDIEHTTLTQAHKEQRLATPEAKQYLERAQALGERAVRLAPSDSSVHRSLGLVYAAQNKFDLALKHYDKAIELNPNAWGAMINKSEILDTRNQTLEGLELLTNAYEAMEREYNSETVKIRPWHSKIGIAIAKKSNQIGKSLDAEIWYRRVLNYSPLDVEANLGLMELLKSKGEQASAKEICHKLQLSVSPELSCQE
ncbi:MAG: winged helix-turn-helix domain-containing protein [Kangiellaceae bacterium]|nr:winged helix-turn-helix domain-containing protein [Kangiellaceae bacterium]